MTPKFIEIYKCAALTAIGLLLLVLCVRSRGPTTPRGTPIVHVAGGSLDVDVQNTVDVEVKNTVDVEGSVQVERR